MVVGFTTTIITTCLVSRYAKNELIKIQEEEKRRGKRTSVDSFNGTIVEDDDNMKSRVESNPHGILDKSIFDSSGSNSRGVSENRKSLTRKLLDPSYDYDDVDEEAQDRPTEIRDNRSS